MNQVLNCSNCIDPGTYGRRTDPWGHYVKRYVPELANMPVEYVYEPWKAPVEVQVSPRCTSQSGNLSLVKLGKLGILVYNLIFKHHLEPWVGMVTITSV